MPKKRKRRGRKRYDIKHIDNDSPVDLSQKFSSDGKLITTVVEQSVDIDISQNARSINVQSVQNQKNLDVIATIAIFNIRKANKVTDGVLERVEKVAKIIRSKYCGWLAAEQGFPTVDNPWRNEEERFLSAFYSKDKMPFHKKTFLMEHWLKTGEIFPRVLKERTDDRIKIIKKLDSEFSEISIRESGVVLINFIVLAPTKIDFLDHLAHIGFHVSPVVIVSSIFLDMDGYQKTIVTVFSHSNDVLNISEIVKKIEEHVRITGWDMLSFGLLEPAMMVAASPMLQIRKETVLAIVDIVEQHYQKSG